MRDNSKTDELFNGYGPLSSFSGKINCAFAFKIIDESVHRDLDYIRKIRNHFAHHPLGNASFNESPVSEFCRELSTAKISEPPRIMYLVSVGLVVGTMHNIMLAIKRQKAK